MRLTVGLSVRLTVGLSVSLSTIVKENSALPESVNFIATQRPQKEDPFPIQGGSTAR